MYSEDRVLVAVMNHPDDWAIAHEQGWYRLPVKHAPSDVPHIDYLAFYFTARFGDDRWAIHYYAAVAGHELVTRRDLFPRQPQHPRARDTYFKLMLGPVQHKLPPIISDRWRRVSFIRTTGDRFMAARSLRDLRINESSEGRPFVTLREVADPTYLASM